MKARKKVLFIGYLLPDTNMGGVRQRRVARLLPEHGWDVTVLTHPRDETSVAVETAEGMRVIEVAATDLVRLYRKLRSQPSLAPAASGGKAQPKSLNIGLTSQINRWLMVPDKYRPWRGPAVRRGLELLAEEKFDVIFASLDPRTSLLVATDLSQRTGVPAVLEYRDLWIGNPYYHITQPTPLHRWIHQRLERRVLTQARRVSAVCRGIADALQQTYGPQLRAPVNLASCRYLVVTG